jgi:esterase
MKLFFRHFGQGNPVVILHGLFGISDNWVTFGRRLAEDYEVFIPDLRNHGQSPHSQVFDFPSLSEDLYEFIEDHDLMHIILIGHSLGGKTAMEFALNYPDIITKLIVVDISMRKYKGDRDHQHLINAMLDVDFSIANSRSDIERQLAKTVNSVKLRQFLMKNVYWRDKANMAWRLNLDAINTNLPLIFESVSQGGSFPGPALFIRGELSDYILDEDLPEILKAFPNAMVKTISGASHWVHADAPEEFYIILREFVSLYSR